MPFVPGWEQFRSVLAFISLKNEIDTRPILETSLNTGKRLFVPAINGDDLVFYRITALSAAETGSALPAGLAADLPAGGEILNTADFPALVITPGLAFDQTGNRLGRGRGFYDRFFAALNAGKLPGAADSPAEQALPYTALGLCLNCQFVTMVPTEKHDRRMDGMLGLKLRRYPFSVPGEKACFLNVGQTQDTGG
ncbi:hypothetical protein AGMMS50230_17520 [Spirochaetia bacterium]|nr:hypothetical protein AGMMS50230_17520 [Spirochaetia bacterium]